ncbi:MAG: hypothetical protein KDA70_13160 [Planctomycetaceae bacterium]|nr:hypothetical protein [Planctomycetaceae bacterium]
MTDVSKSYGKLQPTVDAVREVSFIVRRGELSGGEQLHVIEFALWLLVLVLAFSMFVTILVTNLPARRAARIDPITALRHD